MPSRAMQRKKKAPGLMLTSLLDMFTIILIFLIISFDSQDENFKLNPDLTLPESTARSAFKPAVSIAINKGELLMDEKSVVTLSGGEFDERYYVEDQVPELVTILQDRFERLELQAQYEGTTIDEKAVIIVQADRDIEYRTIYLVLLSAAMAGFFKYRLAILKK